MLVPFYQIVLGDSWYSGPMGPKLWRTPSRPRSDAVAGCYWPCSLHSLQMCNCSICFGLDMYIYMIYYDIKYYNILYMFAHVYRTSAIIPSVMWLRRCGSEIHCIRSDLPTVPTRHWIAAQKTYTKKKQVQRGPVMKISWFVDPSTIINHSISIYHLLI